jgi:hypothetical protein
MTGKTTVTPACLRLNRPGSIARTALEDSPLHATCCVIALEHAEARLRVIALEHAEVQLRFMSRRSRFGVLTGSLMMQDESL